MNENLITEIIDLNKVKANLLELQKMWEQLIATMAAKSSKDLKFDNLAQNLKTVTTAEKELANVKQAGLEVDKKKVKITAEIIANYENYSREEQKIIENEIKRRAKVAEVNKELRDRFTREQDLIKVLQRETKSIADLDKQNADLQAIQRKLNLTTKEGIEANAKINEQIAKNKQTIKEYTNVIDAQRRNIGNYPKDMGRAGSAVNGLSAAMVAGYVAIAAAAKQAYAVVKESIDLFLEQEKQSFRVKDAFGSYSEQINAAADAMQQLTTVDAEQYQKLAVLANAYGVAFGETNKVVEQAIGLATEFEAAGLSQEQALKLLAQAQNGNYKAFEKYIPQVRNAANATEAMTIINEAAAKGFQTAQEYAATYGGRIEQIKNATGDLKETIGKGVLTGLFDEEDGKKTVEGINKINEAIEKTGIISKYLRMAREQAEMMLKPFLNLFKIFGDGSSAIDGLSKAVEVWMWIMKAVQTPVRLLWSALTAITGAVLDLKNCFQSVKDIKIEDIFYIIKKSVVELVSPLTDLIGLTDEFSNLLGVQTEQAKLTNEELEKYNKLLFDTKNLQKDIKKEYEELLKKQEAKILLDEQEEEKEKAKEKAIKDAQQAYQNYINSIKKANEEAKLSILLGENFLEVKKKEVEAIYAATKAYYELGGYTSDEVKKLKELRDEIEKINEAILNTPKLLKTQDVKTIESVATNLDNAVMSLRESAPAIKDTSEQFTKLEALTAKLRNAFNDLFGREDIEDWRDTFKESISQVLDESMKLFNTIVKMQQEQLEQELDKLDRLYDKQMSVLESSYERRKKLLEATIDDEEQLAAELARIEEEKLANQKKIEDEKFAKEQEIAKKRAILEKRKAEIEIAAGSAKALVEAIKLIGIATTTAAPGDPYTLVARIAAALAAALTVVGAVTAGIAKVKAIEIPEFWQGGEAEEGQLISVAERGKELAIGESGKTYLFDKKSVLVAPERMRIFSNYETNKILEKQTINNVYEKHSNVNLTVTIDNERIKKYFKLN